MRRDSSASKPGADAAMFGQDDTIELLGIFSILRRRKWLILAFTGLGTAIAAAIGVQLTPTYTSRSSVMLEPRQSNVINVEAVLAGLPPDAATIATQVGLLQSRTFLGRVMTDLRLFDDPEFNATLLPGAGEPSAFASLMEPIGNMLSFLPAEWLIATGFAREQPAVLESEAPRVGREATISKFVEAIAMQSELGSYLISINATSQDAQKSAVIANKIAELYVNEQVQDKLEITDEASGWLGQRIDAMREDVRKAEEAVAQFKVENDLYDALGVGINDQALSDINKELIAARAALAERQARLRLVRDLRARGQGVDAVAEVSASSLINSLRVQETELLRQEAELRSLYGDRHPRMLHLQNEQGNLNQKIGAEITRIIQVLENDMQVAATRVSSIEAQLGSMKEGSTVDRGAEIKLRELERTAITTQTLYQTFLTRYQETREQQEIVQPDARIVTVASAPNVPSSPGPKLFTAAGFLVSAALGSGLALLLERLDRGIRSAREVEALLGLPTLGMVPLLDRLKRNQKPHQYLREKPLSAYAEAVRSVYTSLKLGGTATPSKVVLVTSSLPEEGKTTLTVSLATLVARSNRRVLLLDLDLRHPSVHRELGWQVSAGVVEYMAGERSLDEVIHHDLETGLHFLPVKLQTTTPLEMLESDKMRELIATCREHYDYIFIDTAPVLSVTDTKIAAHLADKIVFVVHWGRTIEHAARDSIQTLREAGFAPAGVALTQIDLRKHAKYGYGDIGQYYTRSQRYYVN